ncbi:hypothetical protein A5675_21320 [Mycobacterium malmoense]|nr:hypothetical protein A5675_21320 [Mycobacterium malmoense]
MLGGVLAPARLMVGNADAALCAAGITLVQLAGTATLTDLGGTAGTAAGTVTDSATSSLMSSLVSSVPSSIPTYFMAAATPLYGMSSILGMAQTGQGLANGAMAAANAAGAAASGAANAAACWRRPG